MNLELKRKYVLRLIESVSEYFTVFSKPIPLRALSSAYSRSLNRHSDGFYETLDELQMDGSIRIELKITGGKVIYPGKH